MVKALIIAIGILIVIGLGWMVFKPIPEENNPVSGIDQDSSQLISPEPDLTRVKLQALLNEHGVLAGSHLSALYDGKDTGKTSEALEENNQELADFMSGLGAPREEFLTMWTAHIKSYEEYTRALKDNDARGTAEVKVDLDSQIRHMGEVLNKLIPSIPVEKTARLIEEHIDLTLSTIEAHAKNDSAEKTAKTADAAAQAAKFANELADGLESNSL